MIKRLILLIIATTFVYGTIMANEEFNVTLAKGDANNKTVELPYGRISFALAEYGNYHRVLVSIENTTTSEAILVFKNTLEEKELKRHKPKISFEKRYPGSRGYRSVYDCRHLEQSFVSIIPQEKSSLFGIDASKTSITKLELPVYLASYNPKKLIKKGPYAVNYKILSEDILIFNIEIKGWSEDDPEYVSTKTAVENYIQSVEGVRFCKNKKHKPSLDRQQKQYLETKDSLVNVINTTIQKHTDWFSTDKPHIKYSELLTKLNNINLNEQLYDCGGHKYKPTPKRHQCGYCSLGGQQIYHQLDDIYQQLRSGKISKDAAVKKAKGLYSCFQNGSTRKKDQGYSGKIAKFYSRIVNY